MKRARDLTAVLAAFWAKRFPLRPPKTTPFSDELLVLADMLMAQIDPDGTKPLVYPPMPAEDYVPDTRVKATGGSHAHSD